MLIRKEIALKWNKNTVLHSLIYIKEILKIFITVAFLIKERNHY